MIFARLCRVIVWCVWGPQGHVRRSIKYHGNFSRLNAHFFTIGRTITIIYVGGLPPLGESWDFPDGIPTIAISYSFAGLYFTVRIWRSKETSSRWTRCVHVSRFVINRKQCWLIRLTLISRGLFPFRFTINLRCKQIWFFLYKSAKCVK